MAKARREEDDGHMHRVMMSGKSKLKILLMPREYSQTQNIMEPQTFNIKFINKTLINNVKSNVL